MYSKPTLSVMRDAQRTDFGQRLAAARKHADLTQGALAKQVGMSQSAYSEAEKSGLGSAFTPQIAKACGVNVDWLATGEGEMIPRPKGLETAQVVRAGKLKGVAVVGRGNGGAMPQVIWTDSDYPVGATGEYAEDIASSDPHAFVVEVEGASMYPKYTPGNFALVEPGTEPDLEDDVLVRLVTGETMIKRLVSRRSGYSLASYNDAVVLHLKPEQIAWMYYVPYPVPRRKIKSRT